MGLFDKIKDLADQHADKVESAIDKVAKVVDDRTGGRYADQIGKGVDAAKGFVGDDEKPVVVGEPGSDDAVPSSSPPSSPPTP